MGRGASVEAVEQVYRDRGQAFFRFALAVTGDRELARDAVQEGFARALRSMASFRGDGSLEGWLARCVMNAAHDLARRQLNASPFEQTPNGSSPDLTPSGSDLRALVRALPERQREALFLRFYIDLDYAAIADILGIEIGTVSATLHAARTRLARLLQEVPT